MIKILIKRLLLEISIGDKLYFSTYEQQQIEKAEKAKPTTQSNEFGLTNQTEGSEQNNSDLEL